MCTINNVFKATKVNRTTFSHNKWSQSSTIFLLVGFIILGFLSPFVLMCLPALLLFLFLISYQLGEQCPAPYPLGSKHLINACRMNTANHVYILGKSKENCYRMKASLVYSFVVVVLAPWGPLVFFLVFIYTQGREVCHMTLHS